MVMRPLLLRPPLRFLGSVSDFSGWSRVISSKVSAVLKRCPGEVGLNFLIGTLRLLGLVEELDHLLALGEHDVGLLPVGPAAAVAALALDLAVHVGHAHLGHLHAEEGLDRLLDLGLGGVAVHFEAQRGLGLLEHVRLLRDQGPADDVVEVLHCLFAYGVSRSSSLPSASCVTSSVPQSSTSYTLSW